MILRPCLWGHGLIVVTGASQEQELRVTQISSVRLKTDGSGIVSSDDERKLWLKHWKPALLKPRRILVPVVKD